MLANAVENYEICTANSNILIAHQQLHRAVFPVDAVKLYLSRYLCLETFVKTPQSHQCFPLLKCHESKIDLGAWSLKNSAMDSIATQLDCGLYGKEGSGLILGKMLTMNIQVLIHEFI